MSPRSDRHEAAAEGKRGSKNVGGSKLNSTSMLRIPGGPIYGTNGHYEEPRKGTPPDCPIPLAVFGERQNHEQVVARVAATS